MFNVLKIFAEEGYPSIGNLVEFTTEDLEFVFDIVKDVVSSLMPIILIVVGVLIGVLVVGYLINRFKSD